jgi:hypothetical protein
LLVSAKRRERVVLESVHHLTLVREWHFGKMPPVKAYQHQPAATACSTHLRESPNGPTSNGEKACRTASGAATLLQRSNPSVLQKPFVLLDQRFARGEWLEGRSSHCLAFA